MPVAIFRKLKGPLWLTRTITGQFVSGNREMFARKPFMVYCDERMRALDVLREPAKAVFRWPYRRREPPAGSITTVSLRFASVRSVLQ